MSRTRPSADRLRRRAEEHLLYEAGMLYEGPGKRMNRHHEDDPVVQNALLESFGVHDRNLIDFLWRNRPMKDTDAIARLQTARLRTVLANAAGELGPGWVADKPS